MTRLVTYILFACLFLLAACQPRGEGSLTQPSPAEEEAGTRAAVVPARATPTFTPPATPPQPVSAIQLEPVAKGPRKISYVTHAGDDRFFAAQQAGQIVIIEDGELLPEPFLDISDRLATDGSERGLLGLAFHPDYADNGWFYVVYTNTDGNTVIGRYQTDPANPNRADPDSEEILLLIEQPFGNHNGGQLLFGPDGYFYIGLGDGGAVGDPFDNAQNPGTLLGAILRLDVDSETPYVIPDDNPFVGQRNARGEVWAIGLRNPFSFTFDRLTGDLYIADVGQEGPEEIDFLPGGSAGGANFGWPILEGTRCYEAERCDPDGYVMPVVEYEHDEGCAVIGGRVYRGRQFPSLAGNYFLADFCLGTIWALRRDADGAWVRTKVYESPDGESQISAIIEDVEGELYVVFYRSGEIMQIRPSS